MKIDTNIDTNKNNKTNETPRSIRLFRYFSLVSSFIKIRLLRGWRILCDVLRGYFSGQPPGDSRPRKGCC